MMRSAWRRQIAVALGALTAALAVAAPAGAVTIGAPDLNVEPDHNSLCGDLACTVVGMNPGAGHLFRAPADGWITEVRFRTEQAPASAAVHTLQPQPGAEFFFNGFFPLEGLQAPIPLETPFYRATTKIPVLETEILALELKASEPGPHELLGGYELENALTGIFQPSPEQGDTDQPDEPEADFLPAIQYEFEAVTVEQPQEEEDEESGGGGGKSVAPPFTPPPTADVEVTKTFLRGKRLPRVGEDANFLVIVRNNGPNTAQGVVLRDNFGRGLAFDKAKVLKGSSGKARCGGGAGRRAGALVCAIGAMAPGARVGIELTFGVTGKPSKGAGKGERRRERNRARVTSTAPRDPNLANNKDQAVARIGEGGAICPPRSVTGTRRNDRLNGSGRNETILALSGNDRVNAKRGRDCVFGEEGRDVLIGGPHSDYIDGGAGNDLVLAADGARDTIVCAEGRRDRVVADRIDRVARDCERVRRR